MAFVPEISRFSEQMRRPFAYGAFRAMSSAKKPCCSDGKMSARKCYICTDMRRIISFLMLGVALMTALLMSSCATTSLLPGKNGAELYFAENELPDLVKCLPAPPAFGSQEFAYDSLRYFWGKQQRLNAERAAIADRDAKWQLDTVFATFNDAFGLKISADGTPEIHKLLNDAISTIEQIRVQPKAYYHRQRPFEYFNDHTLTAWEEDSLRGEGSYPSGHTIRGWSVALILSEINPEAAEALYARGWEYGESRVIVGAHWQSDVDASRAAASIGYSKLQTSKEYHRQVEKARVEYLKLKGVK